MKRTCWIALALLFTLRLTIAQTAGHQTPQEFNDRTAWWREAKFGMFIHWGLYSLPADATDLKGNHKIAEWYFANKEMQVRDYEKLAARFNPVKFNAAQWVRMARNAGMKYLVITSKHHDGFCMFDSKLTDYDIVDATPFKRDPMRELANECQRQGVKLCFYHSIMDWHHPDYLPRRPWEKETRPATGADPERYLDYMKGQLRELLTHYGPIGILWWDGGWELDNREPWSPRTEKIMHPTEVNSLIRSLQPNILINDRNCLPEDYATPEQSIPASAFPAGRLWETCMTMNDTWGYATNDLNWKSAQDMIRKLCDIAHKGGNFLLNVGPTAEGEFPPESVERLAAIGAWMKLNGSSIYGTTRSPFRIAPFNGRCTVKGKSLYLHVFEWPAGDLELVGLQTRIKSARVLAGRKKLRVRTEPATVPNAAKTNWISRPVLIDPVATVVELRLAGPPEIIDLSPAVRPQPDGALVLKAADAEINGTTGLIHLKYDPQQDQLTNWIRPKDFVLWMCDVPRAGRYRADLLCTCAPENAGSEFTFGIEGRQRLTGIVPAQEAASAPVQLGELDLPAGRTMLSLRAKSKPKDSVMNLRQVRLTPAR